jgi:hypothetical protein
MAQVVEYLLCKCEALSSNTPVPEKKNKNKNSLKLIHLVALNS